MSFIHPVQDVVLDQANKQVYVVVKNTIVVYRLLDGEYKQVGKWVDNYGSEPQVESQENQTRKKSKSNTGVAVESATATVTTAESLSLNGNIRGLKVFNKGQTVVACTDSNKGVAIFDVDLNANEGCFTLKKREQFAKRPNAIVLTKDEKIILMADKFGDVYSIDIDAQPYDTKLQGERKPLLGHVSMLTDILFKTDPASGKQYVITTDRDEHISIANYPQSFVVDKWLFGHKEFISSISSPEWKSEWLISAGGDDSVFLWNWVTGKLLSTFNYSNLIKPHLNDQHLAAARFQNDTKDVIEYCVAKLAIAQSLPYVAFYIEATKILFILEINPHDGSLSLKQTVDLPANIISLSQDNDIFSVSLDNHDLGDGNFIKLIKFNSDTETFNIDDQTSHHLDNAIVSTLKSDPRLITESTDDIHPLYNIINLKKHGEHYS